MSATIDSRVVTMKFDNAAFERNAQTTMSTLQKLKSNMNFSGVTDAATKGLGLFGKLLTGFGLIKNPFKKSQDGLDELSRSSGKFSLDSVSTATTSVSKGFIAMSTIAITALSRITSAAMAAGGNLVKSLTIAPIKDGLEEYETNLNSVQTILANTGLTGQKGLDKVNKALGDLNTYSDKTIYNFSEMARNIGTFTSAGVDLKTSTMAIKGIANLAAISGSNSQQASTAMYQLSQALASGTVKLMDWNSVVNAGMGGKVFQEALKETARAHGIAIDDIIKKEGSFRDSLQTGWLSSKILTETLQKFTGDMTASQLKQIGYTDEQIKGILKMGKTAQDAATKVKTMSQLIGTLQEAVGSGWAKTWQLVFGDFGEAKKLFTGASNVLGGMIQKHANARNKILAVWKKKGGRDLLIDSISNSFSALLRVIQPIKRAFRDIFPPMTGKVLYQMTKSLAEFTKHLQLSGHDSRALHRIFRGLFSVLDIGIEVLKGFVRYWLSLFGLIGKSSGGVLDIAANIGQLLTRLHDWLVTGGRIKGFFDTIIEGRAKAFGPLMEMVGQLLKVLAGLMMIGADKALDLLSAAGKRLQPILKIAASLVGGLAEKVTNFLQHLDVSSFTGFATSLKNAFANIDISSIAEIGTTIKEVFQDAFSSVDLTSLTSITDGVKRAFTGVVNILRSLLGGLDLGSFFDVSDTAKQAETAISTVGTGLGKVATVGDRVRAAWSAVANAFHSFNDFMSPVWTGLRNLFAEVSKRMAGFVKGIGFDDALSVANTGFFIAMYMMIRKYVGAAANFLDSMSGVFDNIGESLEQVTKNLKTMQTNVKADIIIKIAGAIAILAGALYILSKIKPKQLGIALGAVTAMLVQLIVSLKMLERGVGDKGALAVAVLSTSMVALSTSLLIMAGAIAVLGRMKVSTLKKGIISIAAVLATLVAATALLNASGGSLTMIAASVALVILAGAMIEVAGAVLLFSKINTKTLANGMLKIAGALALIGLAMATMPPTMVLSAAGLVLVAGSLVVIAGAMKMLSKFSWEEIAKSMVMLAGSLTLISLAMAVMQETAGGAAAMFVFAAALAVLVPPLIVMGSMSWEQIGKGLLTLAGVFAVLGVAGLVLTPVIPMIIALAGAIALLGVAALAAGGGILMLSVGLAGLAASGTAGIAVLTAAIIGIAELFPLVMHQIGLGIRAFAVVIGKSGPALVEAFSTVLHSMVKAAIKNTPSLRQALIVMVNNGLYAIRKIFPNWVKTGFAMLVAFLQGVRQNIGKLNALAADIVVRFLDSMGKKMPRLTEAGVRFILKFMNGLTSALNKHSKDLGDAGAKLGWAIISGMVRGLLSGNGYLMKKAGEVASNALHAVMGKLGIHSPSREFAKVGAYSTQGLANGLEENAHLVTRSAEGVAESALDTIRVSMSKVSDALSSNVDMNPVIAPVLDLTQLQQEATKISGALGTPTVTAGVSYQQAADISASQQASQDAAAAAADSGPTEIKFEQNLYSPEPLNPVKVYRSTKSQLEMAKEALK